MLSFLRKILLDIKIYIRLYYRYPKQFKGSRVLSLLPPSIEPQLREDTVINPNVLISPASGPLGRHLYIGRNTIIMGRTTIGSYTSISHDVKIGLMDHPPAYVGTASLFTEKRRGWITEDAEEHKRDTNRQTIIGNDVLISANALVRVGVQIHDGAIVGAGAFVNKDVPPYAIVAGVPAKIIRYRFDEETIALLLKSRWWEYSDEEIRAAGHFNDPCAFLERLPQRQHD